MNDKSPFQSKTYYGGAILILPNVLRLIDAWFGTHVSNPELDVICTTVGGFLVGKGRYDAGGIRIK